MLNPWPRKRFSHGILWNQIKFILALVLLLFSQSWSPLIVNQWHFLITHYSVSTSVETFVAVTWKGNVPTVLSSRCLNSIFSVTGFAVYVMTILIFSSPFQTRLSQCQYYWHSGPVKSLLQVTVLCIVGWGHMMANFMCHLGWAVEPRYLVKYYLDVSINVFFGWD